MSIKALIFDLHGVLLISHDESIEISMAKRLNIPVEQVGTIFHGDFNDRVDIGELTQRDFWLHSLNIMGLPHSRLPELDFFFEEEFFIDPVMLGAVREYHKNFKTAMLTNYSEGLRSTLESHWDVSGAFDEIIISWEIKMIKPHPNIFDYTLKKLHVLKEEAVLIDDRIVNTRGAEEYGMHAVHFKTRDQAINDLEKLISANNSGFKRYENIIVE
jgi:epoxide hydrolase-like predicted phosphatase